MFSMIQDSPVLLTARWLTMSEHSNLAIASPETANGAIAALDVLKLHFFIESVLAIKVLDIVNTSKPEGYAMNC